MINLSKLFGRFDRRTLVNFAADPHTQSDREAINAFLHRVLPEEEKEFIDSYFISDEATIFDCSLADPQQLQANVKAEYDVDLSMQELRLPLYILVDHIQALTP